VLKNEPLAITDHTHTVPAWLAYIKATESFIHTDGTPPTHNAHQLLAANLRTIQILSVTT